MDKFLNNPQRERGLDNSNRCLFMLGLDEASLVTVDLSSAIWVSLDELIFEAVRSSFKHG